MVKNPSKQHQELLKETIFELEGQGYSVIDLSNSVPDAIAVKDNKIYAVEVILVSQAPKNEEDWKNLKIVKNKRNKYCFYEDVIFKLASRYKHIKFLLGIEQRAREKKAQELVDDFIMEQQAKKS